MSLRLLLSAVLIFVLVACQSSEERAEAHYQTALELLEAGDLARASVEFRNVFQLNALHVGARRAYAQALREAGNLEQAYGQFLRLSEQLPEDLSTRLALSEMSIEVGAWDQLQIHGTRLLTLSQEQANPGEDSTRIAIVGVTLDYAVALENEEASQRRRAAADAEDLLQDAPDNLGLYRILVDSILRDGDVRAALALLDRALTVAPENRDLHNTKLSLLAEAQEVDAVRTQLEEMIVLYPEDTELVTTLLRFHISQGDVDIAEAYLRESLANFAADEDSSDLRVTLIQFLLTVRGPEAALAEIETQTAAFGNDLTMSMMHASIQFAAGQRDAAILLMSDIIEAGEGEVSRINDAKIALAGMLIEEGNPVGARLQVNEVLEADPTHEAALRLEAAWLIDDDRADEAIALLRRALDEAPNDAAAMTLMARAHSRNGNHELSRDFLALAFEASNAAPNETLRYVSDLISDELYLAAEEVLVRALRLDPGNLRILEALGQVYVAMGDWGRAEGVEVAARRQEIEEAVALADSLRVLRLNAQGQTEDALSFLRELVAEGDGNASLAAQIAVISTFLNQGQIEEALAFLNEALTAEPDNIALLMALGSVERAGSNLSGAIATYRDIVEAEPLFERAWIELIRTEFATGDAQSAQTTLNRALAVLPEGANLLWAQATFLEGVGDVEGAIAIYESLYEILPDSAVIANNLASLISTYRTDDESLERAYTVARRLRDTEIPAMMDTYGWISFRRGEIEEARPYLEAAAAVLMDDPLVQFHYGMLLAASGESEAAIEQLTLAVELVGSDDMREQFDIARAEIARLQNEAAAADVQ